MKTLLFTNWKSTVLGILGGLYLVLPSVQTWLKETTHITPLSVLGLVIAILGILTRETPSTTTAPTP